MNAGHARIVKLASPNEGALGATTLVPDLPAPLPAWVGRLWTAELTSWLAARYDLATQRLVWLDEDATSMGPAERGMEADLSGMAPLARAEFIICAALDARDGILARPSSCRPVAVAAKAGSARSLQSIDPDTLAYLPKATLRRWQTMLEVADADPEAEWLRDEVRIAVVRPTSGKAFVLRIGEMEQPWLRDILVNVLRTRLHGVAVNTLLAWARDSADLSRFLSARPDRGMDASRVDGATMTRWANAMKADPTVSDVLAASRLRSVSSLLSSARGLGFTDRHGLPSTFTVRHEHHPKRTRLVTADRGFPDATFRFLLGADDIWGERVFQLARTIPGPNPFRGDLFVTVVLLSANFGRRPEEVVSLKANRLRTNDAGGADLLYDNFKSGRDHVWLPIDARAAGTMQAWIERLRVEFPTTALEDLALFPRKQKSLGGTQPMRSTVLSAWWRSWVELLEQAIIIGQLAHATGLGVAEICGARVRDVHDGAFALEDSTYPLPTRMQQHLVDYSRDLLARVEGRMYAPADLNDMYLFPDPLIRPGGEHLTEYRPVRPSRFNGLGPGWEELAATYESGGIPGFDLGAQRISPRLLTMRLFRHTYLQHLVNLGTDIFVVQELADHTNVQTTIDSYVRVQEEKLREAVDRLAQHRINTYGQRPQAALPLTSIPVRDVGTNECTNPQVLALGTEGCEYDRLCFGCDHLAADPSNIPEIKAEIHTCNLALARVDAQGSDLQAHHSAMLKHRRDGWTKMLHTLTAHLEALDPAERGRVETAVTIVRDFRNRVRRGGINLGSSDV